MAPKRGTQAHDEGVRLSKPPDLAITTGLYNELATGDGRYQGMRKILNSIFRKWGSTRTPGVAQDTSPPPSMRATRSPDKGDPYLAAEQVAEDVRTGKRPAVAQRASAPSQYAEDGDALHERGPQPSNQTMASSRPLARVPSSESSSEGGLCRCRDAVHMCQQHVHDHRGLPEANREQGRQRHDKGRGQPEKQNTGRRELERERHYQEQEANRQREAKVTMNSFVQDSNLVSFGPGLKVRSVVPGFDLCQVIVRNLPTNMTDQEIVNIFVERGVNMAMVKVLECREESGAKVAKVLTRREEAEMLSAELHGVEFRAIDSKITFEVEDYTTWGPMYMAPLTLGTNPNTMTFFWDPPLVMVATYKTVQDARQKVQELEGRQLRGCAITAIMNPWRSSIVAAMGWTEASVRIGNLAPGTTSLDVAAIAQTTNIISVKPNCGDLASFLDILQKEMRPHGYLPGSLKVTGLRTGGRGELKGTAQFDSQEGLERAATRLNRGIPSWPNLKLRVTEPFQYSTRISRTQYLAQKAQWDSIVSDARQKNKAHIRIEEKRKGQVYLVVGGWKAKEVGALRVRVESVVAGERLGTSHWHEAYGAQDERRRKEVFDRVMAETGVLVRSDRRTQALRLFGTGNRLTRAKDIIRQDVERLHLVEHALPVGATSFSDFLATSLPVLKEVLGEDNIRTDSRGCRVLLRGGANMVAYAQRLVEETANAASDGRAVRVNGGASSPCPICNETPSRPEVLICGHFYCESCLRHYLSCAATSGKFPLVCLGEGATCNTPISVPIIHRYLTGQQFTELVNAVFSDYIQSNPREFKHCTTPNCIQTYRCRTDGRSQRCPACFSRACASCHEEEHEGLTCKEWRTRRDQAEQAEQDRLNEEWARANNVKRCPACGIMTDRTAGCSHMTCRCGTHWNWVSGSIMYGGSPFPDHGNIAHYQAVGVLEGRAGGFEPLRYERWRAGYDSDESLPWTEGGRIMEFEEEMDYRPESYGPMQPFEPEAIEPSRSGSWRDSFAADESLPSTPVEGAVSDLATVLHGERAQRVLEHSPETGLLWRLEGGVEPSLSDRRRAIYDAEGTGWIQVEKEHWAPEQYSDIQPLEAEPSWRR